MANITHADELVTKGDLSDFYTGIYPYLGVMPEAVCNKFSKGDLYSSDEKIIGCWTDGKPIYQKVLTGTFPAKPTPSSETPETVTVYQEVGASISEYISINGFYKTNAVTNPFPQVITGFVEASGTYANLFYLQRWISATGYYNSSTSNANKVRMNITAKNTGGDPWGFPYWLVVRYTKTTDAANSFNYGFENDYSTSEKIIGTWIDGKPLYQKTINFGAGPNKTTKIVAHGISNIDKIFDIKVVGHQTTNNTFYTIPWVNSGTVNEDTNAYVSRTNITIGSLIDASVSNIYVTLQYTKTTD